MRFNPPPNWPAPPEGWVPEPGWQPGPNLPPMPPGWQLWVPEPAGPVDEARVARRNALKWFWVATAFVLVGSALFYAASDADGGFVWTGAFIFGAIGYVRAGAAYRASRRLGAPAIGPGAWALVAVAVVVAVTPSIVAIPRAGAVAALTEDAGSCWVIDGEEAFVVSCTQEHDVVGTLVTQDVAECPNWYIEREDSGYLCVE